MSAILARKQALLLAAVAQVAFARVRALGKTNMDTCDTGKLSEHMIRAMVPMLMGMDALADAIEHDHDPAMIDHTFDVLAQIGHDQARGKGLFANSAVRPEVPYIAALKSPPIAKAVAGTASLDGLSDTSAMLSTIQSLASRVGADSQATAMGELFSVVANGRIKDIKDNKGETHELVGIYERVRDEFIAICGDRRVGEYRRKDLQRYVDQISWLPPEASSQRASPITTSSSTLKPTRSLVVVDWRRTRSSKAGSAISRRLLLSVAKTRTFAIAWFQLASTSRTELLHRLLVSPLMAGVLRRFGEAVLQPAS